MFWIRPTHIHQCMLKKSMKTMHDYFYWLYSLPMVGYDENAIKHKQRYINCTCFVFSSNKKQKKSTISLPSSNPSSQTLKHIYL